MSSVSAVCPAGAGSQADAAAGPKLGLYRRWGCLSWDGSAPRHLSVALLAFLCIVPLPPAGFREMHTGRDLFLQNNI